MTHAILSPAVRAFAAAVALGASTGCLATTQQEVELGNQYATEVAKQLPLVTDAAVSSYLTQLGTSISRVSDDRSLAWTFHVVNQSDINAFAVPGGHIYVYRGLIEKAATMSELAGVMGHEIAHVTRRHSMLQMRDAERANVGVTVGCILAPSVCNSTAGGAAINVAGGAVFAKFSRDDEAEADDSGVQFVVKAGIDPRGIPAMFRTLLAERKSNPSAVDNFFSSHPVEESRIAATEAAIAKLPAATLSKLTRDTQAFRTFKSRLASLPKAAK